MTHFSPPGHILKREFLEPFDLSVNAAATAMKIPRSRLNEIVLGTRAITVDTALRLGRFFNTGAVFWINLQSHYDLAEAEAASYQVIASIPVFESAAIH